MEALAERPTCVRVVEVGPEYREESVPAAKPGARREREIGEKQERLGLGEERTQLGPVRTLQDYAAEQPELNHDGLRGRHLRADTCLTLR
jgi:hypothetical protein